jgi:ATP-dependent protease ClpP protease subunit
MTATLPNPYLSNAQSDQLEQNFFNIPNIYLKFESGISPTTCHMYIHGVINGIDEFANILHALRTMRDKDRAIIYINSPGGNLTTGAMIASAIQNASCHTTTIATGFVASAGALIWSAGQINKVRPGSLIMMHCSSHFDMGNSLDIRDSANRLINYVKYILTIGAVKKGHLLPEELNNILTKNGIEVYINYETMTERLKGSQQNSIDTFDPKTQEVNNPDDDITIDDIIPDTDEPEEEKVADIQEGAV